MMSVAEGGARSTPRGRLLLWLALALSVTLNVFFVGGMVWSQLASRHQPNFAERIMQAGAELELSPSQRETFNQFAADLQERTTHLRESNQPLFQRAWDELAKPQPDLVRVGQFIDEATANRHAYQQDAMTALAAFLDTLSPDQRAQFVATAKHPPNPRAAPLRRLIMP